MVRSVTERLPIGATPVNVAGLSGVAVLTAGNGFSCAVLANGTVKCWGANDEYQLGDGTNINRSSPGSVIGLTSVTSMAAGDTHACAVTGSTVKCWGANAHGQLGDGTTVSRSSPANVFGIATAANVGLGDQFSCAVLADGTSSMLGRQRIRPVGQWHRVRPDFGTSGRCVSRRRYKRR